MRSCSWLCLLDDWGSTADTDSYTNKSGRPYTFWFCAWIRDMSLTVCSNGADYGKFQRQPDKIGSLSRVLFYSQHQLFILFQSRLWIFFHVASSISINKNKTSHPCLVGCHFLISDNEKNTESCSPRLTLHLRWSIIFEHCNVWTQKPTTRPV